MEFSCYLLRHFCPLQVDECSARELAEATLNDFTTYGNGIHGVELSVVGHVQLSGFRVADNVVNGIEIQETMGEWGGPQVKVRVHVGKTVCQGICMWGGPQVKVRVHVRRTAGQGTCACGEDRRSRYVCMCAGQGTCACAQVKVHVHVRRSRYVCMGWTKA